MAWPDPITDLRILINDRDTDHEAWRKKCVGDVNGTNVDFKTWEKQRVTDFTAPLGANGVFVDGLLVAVSSDLPVLGQFSVAVAPSAGSTVEATYYHQWFLDTDLDKFLKSSSHWLGFSGAPTDVPEGLQPAALHYAAQEAFTNMGQATMTNTSDVYLMEEGPKEKKVTVAQNFLSYAKLMREKANELRDNFYEGQGQASSPMFVSINGRVPKQVPER